jgi:hypothetical protein
MNSTTEKQTSKSGPAKRDPFADLRRRGLIRDPTSKKRHLDPPTITASGGSVADIVERWR